MAVRPRLSWNRNCEKRRYHYLVPFSALRRAPPPSAPCAASSGLEVETPTPAEGQPESLLDIRKRLKKCLAPFSGAHDFRNFTRQDAGYLADNETTRLLFRCHCAETALVALDAVGADGETVPYAVLSIAGQSFLYHHIRKMVGAVVAVMRGGAEPDFIARALLPPRASGSQTEAPASPPVDSAGAAAPAAVAVPLAPAAGLYLVDCCYTQYCGKHAIPQIGGKNSCLPAADGADSDAAVTAYRDDWELRVHARVAADECGGRGVLAWLRLLEVDVSDPKNTTVRI